MHASPAGIADNPDPLRVLVVDDEPSIVDVLCTGLRHYGYQVTSAMTGADAPAHARDCVRPLLAQRGRSQARARRRRPRLAIADAVVAAHDGSITAEDAPGGGARFVVTLPATDAASSPSSRETLSLLTGDS